MLDVLRDITISDIPLNYLKMETPFPLNTINIVAFVENKDLGFGFFFISKGRYYFKPL